jgi:hypothetical protein
MQEKRWTLRPEGSNWGDFGADDQVGRLNLITPECRRNGAAAVDAPYGARALGIGTV